MAAKARNAQPLTPKPPGGDPRPKLGEGTPTRARIWTVIALLAVLVPVARPASALPTVGGQPVPAGDEVVTGRGDSDGWHLYAAAAGDGWNWHPLATLAPPAADGERWTGRQCVTGDGRYVVAVIAPWSANNTPAGMEAGGLAYVVDARTGAVHPLVGGVSLHYFTPACGPGHAVALTRYSGTDEQATELVRADAAAAKVDSVWRLAGQLTGAVPDGGEGLFAVRGSTLVQIARDGREQVRARLNGVPFDLTANAAAGVDFLLGKGHSASVWRLDASGARQVGTGTFERLALFNGRAGHTLAAGIDQLSPEAGIRALPAWVGGAGNVDAVSLDGQAVAEVPATTTGKQQSANAGASRTALGAGALPHIPLQLRLTAPQARALRAWTPDVAAPPVTALPRPLTTDGYLTPGEGPLLHRHGAQTQVRSGDTAGTPTSTFTSTCAVPRNHTDLQAMQPSAAMVDWAANLAGRSLLAGAHARPAGFDNLGLPTYSPSVEFPIPALLGSGGKTVPREILEAIFAQESNFKQASWHSIQGLAGNPLIADYYGAGGSYQVGVQSPDCGYGLGQVTDHMTTGAMDPNLQRKVAVDYAENAAAAAKILGEKWNELINAGITANDTNSDTLENWYLAVWDYNSGLHPNTGAGPWGLGWLNNPANPAYPYNRHPFLHKDFIPGLPLQLTYDDASHPGDWPYQEKVFGWMEVPIIDSLSGLYSYTGTIVYSHDGINDLRLDGYELFRPGRLDFCDTAKNACDPSSAAVCTRGDLECWWHFPVSWCDFTHICHGGEWTVDPGAAEPVPTGAINWFPPACDVNTDSDQVPPGSVVVDSQPDDQPHGLNLEGCDPAKANWKHRGSFSLNYGDPDNPQAQATDMDLHQLGAGLGGHLWFTHTGEPTDPQGLSYWGVTGTWAPLLNQPGSYDIRVFVPPTAASASAAPYTVANGYGARRTVVISQNDHANVWVSLGTFWLSRQATVSLTNLGTTGSADLAFSGVAFVPVTPGPGPYAIVGDSFSSGEGTGDYDQGTDTTLNNCHRSPHAFGRQYAAGHTGSISDLVHLACSGAVIANLTINGQNGEAAQIGAIPARARLVTVTIGGNDAGFANVLTRCLTPGLACEDYYNQDDDNNEDVLIEGLRDQLAAAYAAIRDRIPYARVVAITYPNPFAPGTTCPDIAGIAISDIEWLIGEAFHLDNVIIEAARDAGIEVLDERYAFSGHELCTGAGNSWVYSLPVPWPGGSMVTDKSAWFHPTPAGHARLADDVAAYLSGGTGLGTAALEVAMPWTPRNLPLGIATSQQARTWLGGLPMAMAATTPYDREMQFGSKWRQIKKCNTRQDILRRDALRSRQHPPVALVPASAGCPITEGSWETPYEDSPTVFSSKIKKDIHDNLGIDHIVPLENAWNSGAAFAPWDDKMRRDLANDEYRPQLLTVSKSTNSSKMEKSPDQWMPPNTGLWCIYDDMWVAVKKYWNLGVTDAERNALSRQLAACP